MREIKFRVWDKEEKKMLDDSRATWILHTRNHVPYSDRYVLVQYTGLKDKNGKEIYEGDIVESAWNNAIEEIKDIRSVDWLLSDGFLAGQENDGCLMGARVIGNIYENPEL